VAIALLAARILEDKGFFSQPPGPPSTDGRQLLEEAEKMANGFFTHVLSNDLPHLDQRWTEPTTDKMLRCIMAHLTGPACFSLVTPDMLGDLYERALVAERKRGGDGFRELKGIHYTPLSLTKHILARIPVEDLPPEKRYALDFACGAGPFLLAATERLAAMFDANETNAEPTLLEHLRKHVIGNDLDDIALLVTRLAYLLVHWIQKGEGQNVPEPEKLWRKDALALRAVDFKGMDLRSLWGILRLVLPKVDSSLPTSFYGRP
jgi:hypothetical protein